MQMPTGIGSLPTKEPTGVNHFASIVTRGGPQACPRTTTAPDVESWMARIQANTH